MGIIAGTLEFPIKVDSSGIASGLSAAEKKVKGFGDKLSSWAVAKGQMLGNLITRAGQSTVQFVKGAIEESKAFNKSMSQVAATLGKSTSEIQDLTKFARLMGSKTAFTATEAAEGLNYMALAGYDAEKSMRMLPTVLNLAAAGNMKLADASDMVTDAQSALGLSIEETEVMVDQMAKTSSLTNTSVSQLGSAFLTIGGTAKKLKGGTAELSAMLGVLANNGIKGAEGGTALRNVLNGLSNPVGKAAKQLKRLKVDVYDKEGNLRSMADVLTDFNDKTQKMTTKKRTELFAKMFNIRDLKSIEALLSMTKQDWIDLTEKIEESEGAADKMAKTQLDNLNGDMTIFGSALSEAKLAIMDGITPALRTLVKSGTYWLSDLTKNFKEKGLTGAIETAQKAFNFFTRKMTRSKNPVVKFLAETLRAFRQGFTWEAFGGIITKGWKLIQNGFEGLGKLIFGEKADGTTKWPSAEGMIEKIKEIWGEVEKAFEELGSIVFGKKADGTTDWPTAEEIFQKIKEIWDAVLVKAETLIPMIFGENSAISDALTNAIHFIQDFGDWVTEHWEEVQTGLLAIGAAFAAWKVAEIVASLSPLRLILLGISIIVALIAANWDTVKQKMQEFHDWIQGKAGEFALWCTNNLVAPMVEFIGKIREALDLLGQIFGIGSTGNADWTGPDQTGKKDLDDYTIAVVDSPSKPKRRGVDPHKAIEAAAEAAKNAEIAEGNYNTTLGKTGEVSEKSTKRVKDGMDKSKESIDAASEGVGALAEGLAGLKDKTITITTIYRTIGSYIGAGKIYNPNSANVKKIPGSGTPIIEGKYDAKGDWSVPYDDYITRLHRGEMVLTKSQARQYREGGNSGNIDIAGLAASIVAAVKEGMANATVNSYLDGKGVTRRVNRRNENRDKARRFVTA